MLIEVLEKEITTIKKYVKLGLIPNQYLRYIEIYNFYSVQEDKKLKDRILSTAVEFNIGYSTVRQIIKRLKS
jgi:hypothetical protein